MKRWLAACCRLAQSATGMSSDASSSSTFSLLFNHLKHLRCHHAVSDDVIDVRDVKYKELIESLDEDVDCAPVDACELRQAVPSLTDPRTWRPVYFKSLGSGVIVVPGVIEPEHCKIWFQRLLHEYPEAEKGFRSNVSLECLPTDAGERLQSGLRWLTFGYHYLWGPKYYDLAHPSPVPPDLDALFRAISRLLRIGFQPEAGIINYYTCKSRLSPHADIAEKNHSAPLFNLSFGGSAILMVGGTQKKDTPVVPILLSDGDLVIMREGSRLAYHAVPKIYCPEYQKQCSGIVRININARQVF